MREEIGPLNNTNSIIEKDGIVTTLSISELETPGNWFSIIGMTAEIALADVRTKEIDSNAVLNHILFLIFIKLLTSSLCYLALVVFVLERILSRSDDKRQFMISVLLKNRLFPGRT